MDRTVAFFTTIAGILAITALIVYAFMQFTGTPDVIFSWETKKCIKVINADGTAGDCAHLPKKYTHIWGK
jgi:hypothetical protein